MSDSASSTGIERARSLADCPLVLFIVYRTAADAAARGYEDWLCAVDNPFFNAIPGIRHYANWIVEDAEAAPPFSHFDFLGLERAEDLERVWFNPELDAFRRGWVAKWGYGPAPQDMHRFTYGMRTSRTDATADAGEAWLYGGIGPPPDQLGTVFETSFSLAKHFASDGQGRPADWRLPADQRNPLGCDWVGLAPHRITALDSGDGTIFAYPARCIAKPD